MAVTVKIPTQLRSVTGGEGETSVDGAATRPNRAANRPERSTSASSMQSAPSTIA